MMDDLDVLSDLVQLQSRYEILGELGRDGAFAVYRGRSQRSDCEVAIKVLSIPHPATAKPGARFGWQAHTVTELHHPNLLGLHAVHHLQGGALALAMERPKCRSLAEVIRSTGPLPPEQVELVLRDVAGALAYLHGCGVVHRGVRPQSIFLEEQSGRALLAHFGIDEASSPGDAAARGTLARAFAYLAPEQIDGATQIDSPALSAQSDLYSLGLVGYAMLAGKQPWEGTDVDGIIAKQQSEPLPPLTTLRPEAPPHLCLAVEGALDKKPGRRWKSAEEFLARLEPGAEPTEPARAIQGAELLAGVGSEVGALVRSLRGQRMGRRGRLVLAASGVVAAVAALGVLQSDPPPASHAVVESWVPAVAALAPVTPEQHSPADDGTLEVAPSGAVVPAPAPGGGDPGRRSAASGPRALPAAVAHPAPARSPSASSPRRSPRLLGDPVPSSGPVLLGTPLRSGSPSLLGTPVQTDRTGEPTGKRTRGR